MSSTGEVKHQGDQNCMARGTLEAYNNKQWTKFHAQFGACRIWDTQPVLRSPYSQVAFCVLKLLLVLG